MIRHEGKGSQGGASPKVLKIYISYSYRITVNMPTIKQKKALQYVVENGGNVSKAMVKANYSVATAHTPKKLTDSKGWYELLAQIEDKPLLDRLHDIAHTKDARASIASIKLLFLLKDRMPSGKLKITAYTDELIDLQ